jgi:hypothetical protein
LLPRNDLFGQQEQKQEQRNREAILEEREILKLPGRLLARHQCLQRRQRGSDRVPILETIRRCGFSGSFTQGLSPSFTNPLIKNPYFRHIFEAPIDTAQFKKRQIKKGLTFCTV